MIKKPLAALSTAMLLGSIAVIPAPAFASDTTTQLLDTLRANGSISEQQYRELKQQAQEDEQQAAAADWTDKVKLKGDIRLRYQHGDQDDRMNTAGHQVNRDRGRVRYRLGVIANPLDNLEVGAGLASGGDDPRSTNQTFDDTFSTKGIQLDYAYTQYAFNEYFKIIGGKFKFKNYLWAPTDLIWDGDINPEGVSAHFGVPTAGAETFVNAGYWILNEFSSNASDPYMVYGQLGQGFGAGNLFGTVAATYYAYSNTAQPGAFDPAFSAGTNTDNQFGVATGSAEIGTKIMNGGGKVSLIGDYVVNTETDTSQDTGFDVGGKLSINKWSFKYIYADLDANAVPDSFPDSDRFGGATAMKGHEVAGEYALAKNVELGLDYYNTEGKSSNIARPNVDEQILQADLVVKFP